MTQDFKMYVINVGVFGLSLSSLDVALKTTLMIVTIGYTAHKWYLLNKNK